MPNLSACLLYTSDAADERSSVDLGGRRILKKQTTHYRISGHTLNTNDENHQNTTPLRVTKHNPEK